ncbi:hypothetical protein B0O80DRAFT_499795 [Mortierella sp. GBAus27b]|nr:hypothetical protein BGX31_003277 [Mortierella sp. GBA43]KAI8351879.1 hypothetical protein B0O80DRAFT_499795 [Mortierella sp. GBAus27b]
MTQDPFFRFFDTLATLLAVLLRRQVNLRDNSASLSYAGTPTQQPDSMTALEQDTLFFSAIYDKGRRLERYYQRVEMPDQIRVNIHDLLEKLKDAIKDNVEFARDRQAIYEETMSTGEIWIDYMEYVDASLLECSNHFQEPTV